MTVIVAGAKKDFGFMISDQRVTLLDGPLPYIDDRIKIFYCKYQKIFGAGAGNPEIIDNFRHGIDKKDQLLSVGDLKNYYDELIRSSSSTRGATIFIAFLETENKLSLICLDEKGVSIIKDKYRVILPGDISDDVGVMFVEHDMEDDYREALLSALEKFKCLANRSIYANDNCDIVGWQEGNRVFYCEGNIDDIIDKTKSSTLTCRAINDILVRQEEELKFNIID